MEQVSSRTGPARPRRRRWLVWFLALCAVWTLGAIAWAAVALLTPAGDSPQEAVERKAGTHHDQHQPAGRYRSQVVYVWWDALGNHVTSLGYGTDDSLYLAGRTARR